MARTKATLGQGLRLTDHLGASLFARIYPMETVVQLLEKHGCNSRRVRSFPASTAVYFSMALSLYPEAAYEDVFAAMTQGLAWMQGVATSPTVNKASITEARTKIGHAVLRDLQAQCCPALAVIEQHPDCFYAGLRLVAMDASSFDVPDEQANANAFGYPEGGRAPAGYPKAQCAVLIVWHACDIDGKHWGISRAGMDALSIAAAYAQQLDALYGRPRFQWIRALAAGQSNRGAVAVAYCKKQELARHEGLRRRLISKQDLSP